ncbi:hypothetical protein E3N88_24336 [Mikania micrantha]|uniref:Uncharacterized protein n=1 Tax=Mikania micrantha TaxID=192012 RepID=A0A5N6N4J0_9ASTR|nr:hypothetical protein E3N88_24336 [Mikania micrantha]
MLKEETTMVLYLFQQNHVWARITTDNTVGAAMLNEDTEQRHVADHIVVASLGVLKAGIFSNNSGLLENPKIPWRIRGATSLLLLSAQRQGNKRAAGITAIFENSIVIHRIHESEELGHRSNITFPESSSQRLFDCIVVEIEGTWKPLTRSRLHASVQESLNRQPRVRRSSVHHWFKSYVVHGFTFDCSTHRLVVWYTSPVHRLCRVLTAVRKFTRATDCRGSL